MSAPFYNSETGQPCLGYRRYPSHMNKFRKANDQKIMEKSSDARGVGVGGVGTSGVDTLLCQSNSYAK